MSYRFLLSLCLLSTAVISAMEKISDEIIIYNISSLFNRPTKDAFRITNKKHALLILPQSLLNKHYEQACQTNNVNLMIEWRAKGALHLHEEIHNLFVDNKLGLARKLSFNHTHELGAFCIQSAFFHGIQHNDKPFIAFLLKEKNPSYNSNLITRSIIYSKQLERTTITQGLEWYITQQKAPTYRIHHGNIGGCPPLSNQLKPLKNEP